MAYACYGIDVDFIYLYATYFHPCLDKHSIIPNSQLSLPLYDVKVHLLSI